MSYVRAGEVPTAVIAGGVSAGARFAFQALFAGLVLFRKKLLGRRAARKRKGK